MFLPAADFENYWKILTTKMKAFSSQARRGIRKQGNQRDGVTGFIDSGPVRLGAVAVAQAEPEADEAMQEGRMGAERIADLEAAVVQWERQAGADDPATLDARMRLALAYRERGRDEAAAAELEQAAARRRRRWEAGTRTRWRPGTSSRSATFT